ncbi:MAG: hypothetical protein H6965_13210 [Chromatiaceae bacterium]|nr:hypothetical protein [Chromatiaceae bacterium]
MNPMIQNPFFAASICRGSSLAHWLRRAGFILCVACFVAATHLRAQQAPDDPPPLLVLTMSDQLLEGVYGQWFVTETPIGTSVSPYTPVRFTAAPLGGTLRSSLQEVRLTFRARAEFLPVVRLQQDGASYEFRCVPRGAYSFGCAVCNETGFGMSCGEFVSEMTIEQYSPTSKATEMHFRLRSELASGPERSEKWSRTIPSTELAMAGVAEDQICLSAAKCLLTSAFTQLGIGIPGCQGASLCRQVFEGDWVASAETLACGTSFSLDLKTVVAEALGCGTSALATLDPTATKIVEGICGLDPAYLAGHLGQYLACQQAGFSIPVGDPQCFPGDEKIGLGLLPSDISKFSGDIWCNPACLPGYHSPPKILGFDQYGNRNCYGTCGTGEGMLDPSRCADGKTSVVPRSDYYPASLCPPGSSVRRDIIPPVSRCYSKCEEAGGVLSIGGYCIGVSTDRAKLNLIREQLAAKPAKFLFESYAPGQNETGYLLFAGYEGDDLGLVCKGVVDGREYIGRALTKPGGPTDCRVVTADGVKTVATGQLLVIQFGKGGRWKSVLASPERTNSTADQVIVPADAWRDGADGVCRAVWSAAQIVNGRLTKRAGDGREVCRLAAPVVAAEGGPTFQAVDMEQNFEVLTYPLK